MSDARLAPIRVAAIDRLRSHLRANMRPDDAVHDVVDWYFNQIEPLSDQAEDLTDQLEIELWRLTRAPERTGRTMQAAPSRDARPTLADNLLNSPFRFVALNDVVVPPELEVASGRLDRPLPGGFCGSIEVTWAAETPLLIGETRFEPPRDRQRQRPQAPRLQEVSGPMRLGPNGPWIIPGSTIRGCLRAAVEIVAGGRLSQINAHHRYGLRDFDHPRVRSVVNGVEVSRLSRDAVKAGWLRRQAGDGVASYEIVPCADWKSVAIADLPFRRGGDQYAWRSEWLKLGLSQRYELAGVPIADKAIRFEQLFTKPALEFAATTPGGTGELIPKTGGGVHGRFVFSNRSPSAPAPEFIREAELKKQKGQPKKREYVFIEHGAAEREKRTFQVPVSAWDRFTLINSKPGKNARVPDGSWRDLCPSLLVQDGLVPVFYIGDPSDPENFEFGLTRFFKIAHSHSVGEMRDRVAAHRRPRVSSARDFAPDFVEALFGYVYEKDEVFLPGAVNDDQRMAPRDLARKGERAFGLARLETAAKEVAETELYDTVMTAPRASFAPFYLRGQFKDYSADERTDTALAGRKRYFPRYSHDRLAVAGSEIRGRLLGQIERLGGRARVNEEIRSHLRFLAPRRPGQDMVFRGSIRLHNVTAAEIGALLWALTHGGDPEKPCRHMMGRARPFGAGQMRVSGVALDLEPNDFDPADGTSNHAPLAAPEAWELPDPAQRREGWTTGTCGLTPFLRQFDAYIKRHRAAWPRVPDVAEFLAAADPAAGAAFAKPDPGLNDDGHARYPWLRHPQTNRNEFNDLRQMAKRSNRYADPPRDRQRFLPALPSEGAGHDRSREMRLPYLDLAR